MRAPVRLAQPSFEQTELDEVAAVLRRGELIQGTQVALFEEGVARYLGVPHAVACSSGTSALHLAMMALELRPDDEVVMPNFTFPATANMVEMTGARPVVVDIDPVTLNVDLERLEAALTPRTRVIIPVHLFGLTADMASLSRLAADRGIAVVEDAACALGSTWPDVDGQPHLAGTTCDMACWSFHPRKLITTGEGGMVTTHNGDLARTLRELRNHGATPGVSRNTYRRFGPNYRMTEMQGALGWVQLGKVAHFIEQRRQRARRYHQLLKDVDGVTLPSVPEGYGHVFQAYVIWLDENIDRDRVLAGLREAEIEAVVGNYAIHEQPWYADKYGLRAEDFPVTRRAARSTLCLPLHPAMSDGDQDYVAQCLKSELMR